MVAIGTISGGITLNPVVLGVVNGAGLIVAGIGKKNNYKRKIEMTRIAFTNYEKVLVELRSASCVALYLVVHLELSSDCGQWGTIIDNDGAV